LDLALATRRAADTCCSPAHSMAFASMMGRGKAMFGRLAGKLQNPPVIFTKARLAFAAGALSAMPVMGGDDFFEHKFITDKAADDVVDFYSTEDFLQILGVFPMAIHFVLAGVQWDTSKENTMDVYNAMEISFEITEREETTENGDTVVAWFQKRERFKNFIPFTPFLMWDQVQCYGYNRREDGKLEIFHRGEYFHGPLPIRLLVQLHARYVIWATAKHINSPVFGSGDLEMNEHQRSNVPLHVVSDFFHRLSVAYAVATEAGKLAASAADTAQAEKTLKVLQKLREDPGTAYLTRKSNLKRSKTQIEMADPEAQAAVDVVLSSLGKTAAGREVAQVALDDMIRPQMEVQEPRYGGAFKAKMIKLHRQLTQSAA